MKLPGLPFLKEKINNQYFLSLVFREERIESYIFEKTGDEIRVINSQTEELDENIDNLKFEEILDIADKLITQAEDETHLTVEINKTIFGIKESWVEDSKIKREKLDILKRLCEGLGLSPIGFMTVSEAVVGLLQKEEGAPPSAILTEVNEKNVTVCLVKAGKIIETRQSEIHQSPAFTVDTLLKHFEKMEILPSRFVLLSEDEELVQEFIGNQWSKSLPFLHLPQIGNLPEGFMGKALALGIAKQTGATLADDFKAEPEESIQEDKVERVQTVEQEPVIEPEKPSIEYVSDAGEFFGFTSKDVGKVEPPALQIPVPAEDEQKVTEEIPQEVKAQVSGRQILPAGVILLILKLKSVFGKIFSRIRSLNAKLPNMPKLPVGNKMLLFSLIPVTILLLFVFYYFLGLRANVVLSLEPRIVEKTVDITFSDKSDFDNNIIKGESISTSEEGSTTTSATGKKETGDKAKGTVTVFNSTDNTVTFPAKTTIISSNKLEFLTLDKVTVASQSGDVFSAKTPGKANVNVEATSFGNEYNLPSGTKFTIGDNPSIAAKNDNPFSGGTKKEVVVVSTADLQKARNDLVKLLTQNAKENIQNKLGSDQEILPEFISEEVTKEDFDKEKDEEAKNVTLKGTVSYESLAYGKGELLEYLKTVFPGESFDEQNIELQFENIRLKSNRDVTPDLKLKAKIFPKLDLESLAKRISGKSFKEAEKILTLPQVGNVEIKFVPDLFFLPKNLPRIFKNIKIEVLENG